MLVDDIAISNIGLHLDVDFKGRTLTGNAELTCLRKVNNPQVLVSFLPMLKYAGFNLIILLSAGNFLIMNLKLTDFGRKRFKDKVHYSFGDGGNLEVHFKHAIQNFWQCVDDYYSKGAEK